MEIKLKIFFKKNLKTNLVKLVYAFSLEYILQTKKEKNNLIYFHNKPAMQQSEKKIGI